MRFQNITTAYAFAIARRNKVLRGSCILSFHRRVSFTRRCCAADVIIALTIERTVFGCIEGVDEGEAVELVAAHVHADDGVIDGRQAKRHAREHPVEVLSLARVGLQQDSGWSAPGG